MASSVSPPLDLHEERGQQARGPLELTGKGWWDIAKRVFQQLGADNISLIAAGVAFYAFLSIFPSMIAAVSVYVLVADPSDIERNLSALAGVLPAAAHDIVAERLHSLSAGDSGGLSFGVVVGILLAIWSANKGTKALFDGVNIAYDERDSRGFFKQNALTLLFTVGGAVGGLLALTLIAGFDAAVDSFALPQWIVVVLQVIRWMILALLILGGVALVYRYAAVRRDAKLRWLTPGSAVAAVLWLLASLGFSFYAARFGSYDETYGSLAGVVVLLLWLSISAYVVLFGAEINAEAEHQTAADTTVGEDRPMGQRGAYHADRVAQVPE